MQGSEVGLELVRILISLGSQLHYSIALASVLRQQHFHLQLNNNSEIKNSVYSMFRGCMS